MSFEEILAKPNGATPRWADLAIKTPASPDYQVPGFINPSSAESRKEVVKQIIDTCKRNEIKLLGTADYNMGFTERGTYLDLLGQVGEENGVSVYPGMRLLLEDGLDFIALFEPGTEERDLDDFLSSLGLPSDARFFHNNKPVPVALSPREVVARIRQSKGMVLIVYNDKLRDHPTVLGDPWLWGIILPDGPHSLAASDEELLSGKKEEVKRNLPLARLTGSFARSPNEVGSKKVSIKLGAHNLEGLRIALMDSRVKVRFPHEIEIRPYSRLIAAQWEGGFLDGLKIRFNPGFNAMIGGRGTGKTTIIETLRYVSDEKPKTDRNRENHDQILRDVFMPGSKISVLVESHEPTPKRYVIERIYPFDPVVRDAETGEKLGVNPKDVFRIEVFGNKEIYEISKQQDFQVRLLERLSEKDITPLQEQERLILVKLDEQTAEIAKLVADLNQRDADLSRLSAAEEKLTRFLEMDIPKKIEEKRKFEQESHVFERGEQVLNRIRKMLVDIVSDSTSHLSSLREEESAPLNPELVGDYTNMLVEFVGNFERQVQQLIASVQDSEEKQRVFKDQWKRLYAEGEERFQESLRNLQERYPGVDVNEFISLEKEVLRLREHKANRDSVASKLSMRRDERTTMLGELAELRDSSFEVLKNRIDEWNKELGGKIRIDLSKRGDPHRLSQELINLIPSLNNEQALRIVTDEQFSFTRLAKLARSGDRDSLSILLKLGPTSLVPSFDEETLCRIEMLTIPPQVKIQLNLGTDSEPHYRDVNHLSDGQRCTAILGILMLESPYPLIVDQPEEDLDNAFIVEEIAERFRSQMDKRQFLAATHNANIPVLGDASQILALEADVGHSYLKEGRYGYLDSPEIKHTVESILEGGRQAFVIRKEKYGL